MDVPLTEFTILKDRAEKFDYTYAISEPRNCLYIKEPEDTSFKWKAYLQVLFYIDLFFYYYFFFNVTENRN